MLDALVKKGVLSQKEADTIQSSVKDQALQSSNSYQGLVNKIQVGSWIKELNLSGDLRIRNYYTSQQQQLPAPPNVHNYDANIQRDRWRFPLRLNADFLLEDGWFGGVQLSTSDNRDSATQNATFTGGYDNYNIYISR